MSLAIEPNKITNPTGRGVVGGALNEGGKEVFETALFAPQYVAGEGKRGETNFVKFIDFEYFIIAVNMRTMFLAVT